MFGHPPRRPFFGFGWRHRRWADADPPMDWPFGPFGRRWGGFGRGERFFGRGDLKYALLELLQERPMHGYEMMKALQEQTRGLYTPSPGSVYPTLQMLEDRGFVTGSDEGGKRVYQITEAGRAFLAEGRPEERGEPGQGGFWNASGEEWAELGAMLRELRTLGPLVGEALHRARRDPEQRQRLRRLLDHVRAELTAIARGAGGLD